MGAYKNETVIYVPFFFIRWNCLKDLLDEKHIEL